MPWEICIESVAVSILSMNQVAKKKPTIRDPIPYDLNITCPQTPPHNEKI